MNPALQKMFDMIGRDPQVMATLVESFIEETPLLLASMHAAAETSDHKALGRAAHTMKSTAADFGADGLADLCRTLEAECHAGFPPRAVAQIELIASTLGLSHRELSAVKFP